MVCFRQSFIEKYAPCFDTAERPLVDTIVYIGHNHMNTIEPAAVDEWDPIMNCFFNLL